MLKGTVIVNNSNFYIKANVHISMSCVNISQEVKHGLLNYIYAKL